MARESAVDTDGQTQRSRRAQMDTHCEQPAGQPHTRSVSGDEQQRFRRKH